MVLVESNVLNLCEESNHNKEQTTVSEIANVLNLCEESNHNHQQFRKALIINVLNLCEESNHNEQLRIRTNVKKCLKSL